MTKAGYDNFTQRLADTFAGLNAPATSSDAPTWQPSQQQVKIGIGERVWKKHLSNHTSQTWPPVPALDWCPSLMHMRVGLSNTSKLWGPGCSN